MKVELLGVKIDAVTRQEAIARASQMLEGAAQNRIFTPNPEMLVLASRDRRFKETLNSADLAVPDGVGLLWAARWRGERLPERVTGTDLLDDIAALAEEKGKSVFLLGGVEGIAARAAAALADKHPGLKVAGALSGGMVRRDESGRLRMDEAAEKALREARPDVLFVAFGHGSQEEWIAQHLSGLPSVRLAMGVGGAFDFIAGRTSRAPLFMRKTGLEWLWRLIREPRRWRRIWSAVAVFPALVISGRR